MPIIPMKQTTIVHKKKVENGEVVLDGKGFPIALNEVSHKCSVTESSTLVESNSRGVKTGEIIVSTLKITYDKLADVTYYDEIEYTNELGVKTIKQPKEIKVVRLNGKPLLTEVYL